ncbi:hypothetical protein TRFO_22216 [Tritrichomonas foetus]|uniref:CLASP N-terminal domain-containing protein n=1 Tax=Tritrichomonas foetus TaxID=1144522 RepID=A0A1J4KHB7_9EUKA|nr:hypothetical protein TRFO_22216 [Tritrichomonas foetus]|eukprot:OHT09046.1 hypothetical protein TRFO_22216 [Tritrichomonas foetus]
MNMILTEEKIYQRYRFREMHQTKNFKRTKTFLKMLSFASQTQFKPKITNENIISSSEKITPFAIKSDSACARELNRMAIQLNCEADWCAQEATIRNVVALINGGAMKFMAFEKNLIKLSPGLILSIKSVHETLVKQACYLIARLSREYESNFFKVLGVDILKSLSTQIPNNTQIISDSCKLAILSIIRYCQTKQMFAYVMKYYLNKAQKPEIRQLASESLCVILDCWKRSLIDSYYIKITHALKILLKDSYEEARYYAKKATITVFALYPDRKAAFMKELDDNKIINDLESDASSTISQCDRQTDEIMNMISERIENMSSSSSSVAGTPKIVSSFRKVENENPNYDLNVKFEPNIRKKMEKTEIQCLSHINTNDCSKNDDICSNPKEEIENFTLETKNNSNIHNVMKTPENSYKKLSRLGKLKTPEIEAFSPRTVASPSNKMSLIPVRNAFQNKLKRNPSPVIQSPKLQTSNTNKRHSNSPISQKSFDNNGVSQINYRSRHISQNLSMNSIPMFQFEEGQEMQFLQSISEFINTGRFFALENSIQKIIPGLLICSVKSNEKKISSLAVRHIYELIKVFPEQFELSLPSLFEIFFADLPSEDEMTRFVPLILKEVQCLYNPNLLIKVAIKQFPSSQLTKFISLICSQPSCDLSNCELCCSLINIALKFKNSESKNILIQIAKQNPDMIIKAETDFLEESSYFEEALGEIESSALEKLYPHFSPNHMDEFITKILEIVDSDNPNDNFDDYRYHLYHEIERAFDQTNNIVSLFNLILAIFEKKGIQDYHIFINQFSCYYHDKKSQLIIHKILNFISESESLFVLINSFLNLVNSDEIELVKNSVSIISYLVKNDSNNCSKPVLPKLIENLERLISHKNFYIRMCAVKCYASLSVNYKSDVTNSIDNLTLAQKCLISKYCDL